MSVALSEEASPPAAAAPCQRRVLLNSPAGRGQKPITWVSASEGKVDVAGGPGAEGGQQERRGLTGDPR